MKRLSASLLVAMAFCIGCGGQDEWASKRPKVYRAGGIVNMEGKPLDDATVIYHSTTQNVSAQGTTDKDGRYTLTTYNQNDGAVEGPHRVVITKRIYIEKKTKYDSPTEPSVAKIPKDLLPVRYAAPTTTDILVEVSASGKNNTVIEVKSK